MSIEKSINKYAKRAKKLRSVLHLEEFHLNKTEDAERYLRLHAEYEFIINMFREMSIYNWDKDDFDIGEEIDFRNK